MKADLSGIAVSEGTDQPTRAAAAECPTHERLTRRLQEMLSSLEVDDDRSAQEERAAVASYS